MKFLADENIASSVVDALKKECFDVFSVYEQKLSGSPDEKILAIAKKQKRIILTHDKDFGGLIYRAQDPPCGVILLRLHNQSPQNVIKHLIPFLQKVKPQKIQNQLVVFGEGQVRIV